MAANSFRGRAWDLTACVLLLAFSIWSIRRGETLSGGLRVKRSEDPLLFWLIVLLCAVAVVIGVAGAILS